jgi:hypothetical protein
LPYDKLLLTKAGCHFDRCNGVSTTPKEAVVAHDAFAYQTPTTQNQRILIQSWAKALGIKSESIMRNDCFFAVCKGLWSLTSTDAMSENVENLKTSDTDMISSCCTKPEDSYPILGQGSGY